MYDLYTLHNLFNLTMFASAAGLLTLGIIFTFAYVPDKERYATVRHIRTGMAICFYIIALFSFLNAHTGYSHEMDYVGLLVASIQAPALTSVMVLLICPDKIKRSFFLGQIVFIVLLGVAVACVHYVGHTGAIILRIVTGVLFAGQCLICIRLFNSAYRTAIQRLEDAYDDAIHHRLHWARWGFYYAVAVGIMSYVVIGLGQEASIIYVFAYMAYYTLLTIVFIRYISDLPFYEPIIAVETQPENTACEEVPVTLEVSDAPSFEAEFSRWLERKGYCKECTTADIAEELMVNIEQFRHYVKETFGEDFRTWRMRMRLEEGCRLLREFPEMSIKQIGEAVGIPNRGNFHNYFTRFTGVTPAQYRAAVEAPVNP